jgi:enterochelin esterase family protein
MIECKLTPLAVMILLLFTVIAASAQQPVVGAAAAPFRPADVTSEIQPDNQVVFRLYAPKATEVQLAGQWGPAVAMVKDANGVWSVAVGPLPANCWGYTFVVDGVVTLDPTNADVLRNSRDHFSLVQIAGDTSNLYLVHNVPHGTVAYVWYPSPTLHMTSRRMCIYTPPGYENSRKRYPVLYLLPGLGNDEDAWNSLARASVIMDNLLAQGQAMPCIMIMPNGTNDETVSQGFGYRTPEVKTADIHAHEAAKGTAAPASFPESLVHDIVPYVEKHYRVIANKDHRALAGLSLGGLQTIRIMNEHPGIFSYTGVFSAGPWNIDATFEKQLDALKASGLKLYVVACGDSDTLMFDHAKMLVGVLKKHNINPTYQEIPGGHNWYTWRICLSTFAPQLFR